jgi:hypothetical protein
MEMLAIEDSVSLISRYPACEPQFLEGEHIQSYPYLEKVRACDSVIKNISHSWEYLQTESEYGSNGRYSWVSIAVFSFLKKKLL